MADTKVAEPLPGQITVEEMIEEMRRDAMLAIMAEPPAPVYRAKPGRSRSGPVETGVGRDPT